MNISKEVTYPSLSAASENSALNGDGKQMWLLNILSS